MKKLTAVILAGIMIFALCACTGGTGGISGEVSYDIPEGKQIPDDAVLNVTIASHASWPYREDWKVWEYIKDGIGGTININAVPGTDFATKFPLIMASTDTLPDLIGFQNKPASFGDYCEQGAFLALDDYGELLPDYNTFWTSLPEDEQWMKNTRKSADGKVYYAPIYGVERSTNVRTWLYRKDIFDKHGIKAPETVEELYAVSKKLKELYPTSYPFCMRTGFNNINVIGSTWKPNFRYGVYYDFEAEKWCYGTTEPVMREIVEFLRKMVEEELLPSDFFTINTASWEELVSTDRGFIFPEYKTRIDFFNNIARANNPEYTLASMLPPRAENGTGVNKINKYNYSPSGYGVLNTGDAGRMANAMRYVNWFYSEEGEERVSWGKEGETFSVVNGEKKYIIPEGSNENVETLYGIKTIGTHLRVDPKCIDKAISEEEAAQTDIILDEYTYKNLDPTIYMQFSSEDAARLADYTTSINTMVQENIQKFVLGQKPMSEWDAFSKDLSELPIAELLALYEENYNKIK